jgi:hypothetical protein
MSDEKGKGWKPYNPDGFEHICKSKQQNGNGNGNGNDISVEVLLKKLKSIGTTIDLDVLRNAVNGNTK